jgi:hypothetical protein
MENKINGKLNHSQDGTNDSTLYDPALHDPALNLSEIKTLHSRIVEESCTIRAQAIRVGELLTIAQAALDPAQWRRWLKSNIPFPSHVIHNYARCFVDRVELTSAPGEPFLPAYHILDRLLQEKDEEGLYVIGACPICRKPGRGPYVNDQGNGMGLFGVCEECNVHWSAIASENSPIPEEKRRRWAETRRMLSASKYVFGIFPDGLPDPGAF